MVLGILERYNLKVALVSLRRAREVEILNLGLNIKGNCQSTRLNKGLYNSRFSGIINHSSRKKVEGICVFRTLVIEALGLENEGRGQASRLERSHRGICRQGILI
jgi:hypothetical protein